MLTVKGLNKRLNYNVMRFRVSKKKTSNKEYTRNVLPQNGPGFI